MSMLDSSVAYSGQHVNQVSYWNQFLNAGEEIKEGYFCFAPSDPCWARMISTFNLTFGVPLVAKMMTRYTVEVVTADSEMANTVATTVHLATWGLCSAILFHKK